MATAHAISGAALPQKAAHSNSTPSIPTTTATDNKLKYVTITPPKRQSRMVDGMRTFERVSKYAYGIHVCCWNVFRNRPEGTRPDGSTIYVMNTPVLWGKTLQVGDLLVVDPAKKPQKHDWVHIAETPFGPVLKEYPCEEQPLGVVAWHFPKKQSETEPSN